jgi:hypothetical protein
MSFAEGLRTLLAQGTRQRPETAEQITRFVLGELARRPRERGLCFVSPAAQLERAVWEGLEALGGCAVACEVVLIADAQRQVPFADSAVTWVSPRRAPGLPPFVLLFGDGPAYAMVRGERAGRDGVAFFHSDDRSLVEHLAFQLQRELALPEDPVPAEAA